MVQCYICEYEIMSTNKYDEHIILNSLGGRLHSPDLICSKCSPQFDKIDACLSKQLNPVANMLNIKRDRGTPQPIEAEIVDTSEKIHLSVGGKPVIIKPKIEQTEDGISIEARDDKQAREVLNGLKRKYPGLDVDASLKQAEKERSYLNSWVNYGIRVGGDETFRSVCKTAINFYIYSGGNREYITHLIPYVRDGSEGMYIWHYYPDAQNMPDNLKDGKVLHTIFIRGDAEQKFLYSFIEFFSSFKFIILLSENYTGEEVNYSYSFDVIKRVKLEKNIWTEISKMQILKTLQDKVPPFNQVKEAMDKLNQLIAEKQFTDEISRLTEKVINNFFGKYPEGTIFTQDIMRDLIKEIEEATAPFIDHYF